LLSLRKGTPLTKEMFLDHLYGGIDEPEPKIIDVFICKLRRKLANACDGKNFVETVWGRGHVLRDSFRGSGSHFDLASVQNFAFDAQSRAAAGWGWSFGCCRLFVFPSSQA
jgi:DNA-binding winged helix-turn-helix (wHTH) protein